MRKSFPSEVEIRKEGTTNGKSQISIRKARVKDARQILDLINYYAEQNLMLQRGPQYIYENIRDFMVAVEIKEHSTDRKKINFSQDEESYGRVIGCGSLHILGEVMAEIRSMAIHQDYKGRGLGEKIVDLLIKEAIKLGVSTVFTLTMAEKFFTKCGFEKRVKEDFPLKVWGECVYCPKYFKCDEIGMIMEIK